MLKPRVEVRVLNGVLIAEFWDCLRLDPAPVSTLRQLFETHVQQGQRPWLIVDLNGVDFAGSTALGGFLAIHRACSQRGGRLIFCNLESQVREVFRVSELSNLFRMERDLPAAMAAIEGLPEFPPLPADGKGTRTPSALSTAPPPLRGRRRTS